ncbi:MAG: guanylate kinase [bacterium]
MREDTPGLLFFVAAPSGAGKTSLCRALMQRLEKEGEKPLYWSCSYTTRPARSGEVHGQDYFFVDDETFDRMIEEGEFAEWAEVHGRRYGTSKSYLEDAAARGIDLLVELDIQGAKQLKAKFESDSFIFILPPRVGVLEERLRNRGSEKEEDIKLRLKTAKKEMLEWSWFDYIIINEDFDRAVELMRSVVLANRCRKNAVEPVVESIIRKS